MKNMLFKLTAAVAAIGMLAACGNGADTTTDDSTAATEEESYKIGISQYVTHPSLDATAEGFKAGLEAAGVDVEFDEQNAQAEQGTVNNISGNFAADGDMDLVYAIATPSAITATTTITDKPIVFSAVTDPVDAQIVADWDSPGGNVTGVSDMNPVKEQLELLVELVPDAATVGVPYSSAESNSVVQVEAAREAAEELDLELKEVTVTNSSEVQQAVESLGDVDAIYVVTDNIVVSGFEAVAGYGEANQIPVIAAEPDTVGRGAVATYGVDYYALGEQAAEIALRILQDGENPGDIAVATAPEESLEYVINTAAAEAMGVEIPQEILDQAVEATEPEEE